MMINSHRHEEEPATENTGKDDFLTKATDRVLSQLGDPKILAMSIWGWDGIGRSAIANKMMQELAKEVYFDVVVPVSVPQPYLDHPDPTPSDHVPNVSIQRNLHTPTKPETRLVRNTTFQVLHEPCLEELESALEEDDIRRLTEFKETFLKERAEDKKQLEEGTRWPNYQKLQELHRVLLVANRMREEVENDRLSKNRQVRLTMLAELEIIIKIAIDEEAKELKLLQAERDTREKLWDVEEKASGLKEKVEMLEKKRTWASKMEKWELEAKGKSQKQLNQEMQISLAEQQRQLEEVSRKLKQEAARELTRERRRVLNEQQRELEKKQRDVEEVIRRLKAESEKQLRDERRKAREEAQREMRLRELQAKIVAELGIDVGQSTHTDAVADILRNWLVSRRFLLILKDVWENINLQTIGIPPPTPANGSKVIIIPTAEAAQELMEVVVIKEDFSRLSESQAWQLFNAEAKDLATALPSFANIIVTSTTILECFSYVSLFTRSIHIVSLKESWRSEGFFDELTMQLSEAELGEERVEELMDMIVDALLLQLSRRCMLTSSDGEFQMPHRIRGLVSSRKGLLIRCDSDSEMLPSSNEWEESERISLSRNTKIRKLPTIPLVRPPICPKLQTLFLNHSHNLYSISPTFFGNMTSLQVLDLSSTAINSLPTSISSLQKLRMLKLGSCNKLNDLPEFLKGMQKLEILDLHGTSIKKISLDGMPSLQRLNVSGAANLTILSVNGCGSLSILEGLEEVSELEELDLSGTKIKELPHEIFHVSSLKELRLLRMQHLKKIHWGHISKLPEKIQWHQCGSFSLKETALKDSSTFLISASDAGLFDSLGPGSELSKSHLQNFYFLVCPCESLPKDRFADVKTRQFRYQSFYASHASSARQDWLLKCPRCIEVCGGKTPINGISGVLAMADSFRLRGNEFINKVFYHGLKVGNVRECWIEKCHQLECVVDMGGGGEAAADITGSLENLWLSDLPKLTTVCKAIPRSTSSACLKHLYVERCPKLINFFSSNIHFQNLESLEIKFCPRLENVCGDGNVAGQDAFPQLAEIRLWELSKLKRICNGHLPMVKKLKIRGCPMLGTLPLLHEATSVAAVEIEGETKWWSGVRWEGVAQPRNISFKDCTSFKVASFGLG